MFTYSSWRDLNLRRAFYNHHILLKMFPSPSSSPRPAFANRTNVYQNSGNTIAPPKSWFSLPTPPEHGKVKRPSTAADGRLKKRVKLCLDNKGSKDPITHEESDGDSDVEMEDMAIVRAKARNSSTFQMRRNAAMARPSGRLRQPDCNTIHFIPHVHISFNLTPIIVAVSTRLILQSFVSSHKSDVFKCQSTNVESQLTPPYACSYTHGMYVFPLMSQLAI
jgi:denticleless